MQIDGLQQHQPVIAKTNTKQEKFEQVNETKFENMLQAKESIPEEKTNNELKEKIQTIDQLKRMLDYELTVDNVSKYKDAVQSFLEYYTKNELKMEDHILRDSKGYQKKVSIIRSIDEKLNNINENMLESPLGHIETLKKIGEINGLVVNMLL